MSFLSGKNGKNRKTKQNKTNKRFFKMYFDLWWYNNSRNKRQNRIKRKQQKIKAVNGFERNESGNETVLGNG